VKTPRALFLFLVVASSIEGYSRGDIPASRGPIQQHLHLCQGGWRTISMVWDLLWSSTGLCCSSWTFTGTHGLDHEPCCPLRFSWCNCGRGDLYGFRLCGWCLLASQHVGNTSPCSILSYDKIQKGDILVPAYPGCPGKWTLSKCRRRHFTSAGQQQFNTTITQVVDQLLWNSLEGGTTFKQHIQFWCCSG